MIGGWMPQRYTQNHKKETYEKQEQATKVESTCRIVGESRRNMRIISQSCCEGCESKKIGITRECARVTRVHENPEGNYKR